MRRRGANYLDICFIVGNAERSPGYIRCRIKILKLNKFRCIYVDGRSSSFSARRRTIIYGSLLCRT
jgi:hypothetical protein